MKAVIAMLGSALAASHAFAAETWIVRTDLWGNPRFSTLIVDSSGGRLSGLLDGDVVIGEQSRGKVTFSVTDRDGRVSHYDGSRSGESLTGKVDAPDTNDAKSRAVHGFTAWRVPLRPPGPARQIDFSPTDYSNTFDPDRRPVMTIWPGDSVRTTTLDSGGVDDRGVTRALYGNPQTGRSLSLAPSPATL